MSATHPALLERLIPVVRTAGEIVMTIYTCGLEARTKDDGSPVTSADERAEALIVPALQDLLPGVAVIAEERAAAGTIADVGRCFWLVDALDGTREFIGHLDEFTINVALIEDGLPVLGVVFAPALDRLYGATATGGAFIEDSEGRRPIHCRQAPQAGLTVVASRSHTDVATLQALLAGRRVATVIRAGSSLKLCLIAAGEADLYPRPGRTMEWDIAAGHAILAAAGGRLTTLDGQPLRYGKSGFDNPGFVACGREDANAPEA